MYKMLKSVVTTLLYGEATLSSPPTTNDLTFDPNPLGFDENTYRVGSFKVFDDQNSSGQTLANTGIAYVPSRQEILVCGAANVEGTDKVAVFNTNGTFNRYLNLFVRQGFTYDSIRNELIDWQVGSGGGLRVHSLDSTLESLSNSLLTLTGPITTISSGSIAHNSNADVLYFTADNATNILVYARDGATWTYSHSISVGEVQEGIEYISDENRIIYNTVAGIKKIELDGTLVQTYDHYNGTGTETVNEGICYAANLGMIYCCRDRFIHGGVVDGNVIEVHNVRL